MAISIPSGFKISVQEPVDSRLTLTKAEMLAMVDAKMPEKYFAVCKDDGKIYLYDVNNNPSATTGKFKVFEGGASYTAGENIQINNNVISATDTKYTAGTNITIDANNVISATGGGASYTAGDGISIDNNTIATKLGNGLKHDNGKITIKTADSTINVGEFGVRVPYVSTSLDNTANGLAVKIADDSIVAYNSGTGTKGIKVNTDKIQSKLTAGQNITIENNVISATGGGTSYTAGTNINITDNAISVSIDDIELTGTSGTFTDEQMAKLSNSQLTCLILNNKRFKLQYTSAGRSGIVAMYTCTINTVSEVIEVDVTNKAWALGQTSLQATLTAGDNVSITNNVISAIDTKLATQITLGQAITAQSAIGGIPAGKVYAATDTLATLLTDLLGGETPTGDGYIYYSVGDTVPTSVTGMTKVATTKDSLITSGYTWKNVTLNNQYAFLAVDKALGATVYEILQNGFALGYETVDLGTQWLYYPSSKATDTGIRFVYHFEE